MTELTMQDDRIGEKAERARRRQHWIMFAALAAAGGMVGFWLAMAEGEGESIMTRPVPPTIAAILAVITLLALTTGSWVYYKKTDEVDRHANIWATAFGGGIILILYPVWMILWKGGLVTEPTPFGLYVTIVVGSLVAYFWKKFS
jgi:uncharacterized membrane protein YozB (DUF420 family)